MNKLTRRDWLKRVAAGAVTLSAGELLLVNNLHAKSTSNIVVIGGGFGGATCARYLKTYAPNTNVTLVEPNEKFISCPFSNLVLAGDKPIDYITHNYKNLSSKLSIQLVHDWVTKINSADNTISLKNGKTLNYDFLVVSPGVDFIWDKIAGYDEQASKIIPHAWNAGEQTLLLKKQLEEMKDGGTFIISIPEKPYRAPPAPYERASLVANFLKEQKPKSKILILDPNGTSEKLPIFKKAWDKKYANMIEWVGGKDTLITELDVASKTLISQSGTKYTGDVINLIPPQYAADIARSSGLANKSGWCEVDPVSFESKVAKNVFVIGDSSDAGEMPKIAHSANSQAKACAASIIARISGTPSIESALNSSIYSFISPKSAISEVGVYRVKSGKITRVSGGISKEKASKKHRRKESKFAYGWYKGITRDMFGT